MKKLREIGFAIESAANKNDVDRKTMMNVIGCNQEELDMIFKGRRVLSFNMMEKLADCIGVPLCEILSINPEKYSNDVVHCMSKFSIDDNREAILDDIYDYLDLIERVEV